MFIFDITCDEYRLLAKDSIIKKNSFDVTLCDNHSGKTHQINGVSFCDLEKLICSMVCCHGDVPLEVYPHLKELLIDCHIECRPIP